MFCTPISITHNGKDYEINPNHIVYYTVEREANRKPLRVAIYLTGLQEPLVFEGTSGEMEDIVFQLS